MRIQAKTLVNKIILPFCGGYMLSEAAYAYDKGPHYNGVLKPLTKHFEKGLIHQQSARRFNKKYIAIGIVMIILCCICPL